MVGPSVIIIIVMFMGGEIQRFGERIALGSVFLVHISH